MSRCQYANGGKVDGFTVRPMMIDGESSCRASAATAFYYPVSGRSNLRLIRGSALNLIWNEQVCDEKQALGVRYLDDDRNPQDIMLESAGEVILAAGSLATPGILKASGVGNRSLLEKLGIEVRIELPGVGEISRTSRT